MSRTIWVGIIVVIVIAAGGWWYFSQSSTPQPIDATQVSAEQTTQQNKTDEVKTSAQTSPPAATLSTDVSSGPAPLGVTFTTVPADNETINFGDGSAIATMPGPCHQPPLPKGATGGCDIRTGAIFHTYTTAGTYTVSLKNGSGTSIASTKIVVTASGMNTYSNAQYGFSIDFEKNDPAKTLDYGSLHPFSSAPIVYSGYWITVNASNNPTDVANCTVAGKIHNLYQDSSAQLDSTYNKTINGISFAASDWHDGEPSYERNYTTLHNGMCFDIQLITVPSCALCTGGRPTLASYKPQLDAMDKIAQTFKFTN